MFLRRIFSGFVGTIQQQETVPFLVVIAAYFSTAKLSLYITEHFGLTSTIIWIPAGIALASVLIKGYKMWLPVTLAAFLHFSTSIPNPTPLIFATAVLCHGVQPLIGAYIFKKMGFENRIDRTRDVIILIGGAFLVTFITSAISIATQCFAGTVSMEGISTWTLWSRTWTTYTLSVLIITPLVLTWTPIERLLTIEKRSWEIISAFALLIISIYIIFWTPLGRAYAFPFLLFESVILFYIANRMDPRWTALSLFLLTSFSMAGALVAHASLTPVNDQLFSIQLYLELMAPIFFAFSALSSERRDAYAAVKSKVTELEAAMKRLSNEDKSKNEFIAILAHELRNPLAPILSSLELLKLQGQESREESSNTLELVTVAEKQAQNMRRILDDLLDVARVTQKKFYLQKETILLSEVVKRSVNAVLPFINRNSHTLLISLPENPIHIFVDSVRFEQVLVNLLNNAAKYMEKGGRIEISGLVRNDDLLINIRDSGVGINPEDTRKIFEPFRQMHPIPRAGTGLGIGLSLSKRLVEMHGGKISVTSPGRGKGSTFSIIIPLLKTLPMAGMKTRPSLVTRAPTKILVVDDNEAAAKSLGKLLEFCGHEVALSYTGEEALEMEKSFQPKVVLLDIGLPGIDGHEVAKRLRERGTTARLVALSGYGQEEDKIRAKKSGFDHHLTKPVGRAEIESALVF